MKEIKINYKPENAEVYNSKNIHKLSLATDTLTSIQEWVGIYYFFNSFEARKRILGKEKNKKIT